MGAARKEGRQVIDRTVPVPLYYQIACVLRDRVYNGEWLPGHRVPPEHQLTEEFKVSRHTIRQALATLEREGLIYRQAGSGTFVRSRKYSYPLSELRSFTEQMRDRGLVPSSKVVSLERHSPEPSLRSLLSQPDGTEVWRLKRLLLADGEPVAFEIMFLPVSVAPALDKEDMNGRSMYAYVEDNLGHRIAGATETIEAESAPLDIALLLETQEGAPILRLKNVTYLEGGRPLCFVDCYYRADRYIFSVSMPRRSR